MFTKATARAKTIQNRATQNNLDQFAGMLLRKSRNEIAKVLTARWVSGFKIMQIHSRVSSMLLARIFLADNKAATAVAIRIISNLKIRLDGEDLLTEKGWVDLAIEILALGFHKVRSIDILEDDFVPGYKVYDTSNSYNISASAPQVNQGHLINLKLDPKHELVNKRGFTPIQ